MSKSTVSILLKNTNSSFEFSGSYTPEDSSPVSLTLMTNDQFRRMINQMYGQRVYNDWEGDESTTAQLAADFYLTYTAWKQTRMDNYMRRLYALSLKYNPLENYRSHEEQTHEENYDSAEELSFTNRKDTRKDDTYVERTYDDLSETTKDDSYVERTYDDLSETTKDDSYVERSFSNYVETHTTAQQTDTHNVSADDAASTFTPATQDIRAQHIDTDGTAGSYKDQNGCTDGVVKTTDGSYKDQHGYTDGVVKTTDGSYKDQHGFTQGDVLEKAGKETNAHTGTDDGGYTIDKYGNIGVTTSQQMLESDLDLLRHDLVMQAIREFTDLYTYVDLEVD